MHPQVRRIGNRQPITIAALRIRAAVLTRHFPTSHGKPRRCSAAGVRRAAIRRLRATPTQSLRAEVAFLLYKQTESPSDLGPLPRTRDWAGIRIRWRIDSWSPPARRQAAGWV